MLVRQRIESDSEDSQQQNEIGVHMPLKVQNDQQKLAKKVLVAFCFTIITVCTVLYIIISRIPSSQQPKTSEITSQKQKNIQNTNILNQTTNQAKLQSPIYISPPIVNPIKKTFEPNKTLILPSFNQTKSFGESEFLWKDLKSGRMYWYNVRQISCEPDMLINSASKISDNLFIQKTVYSTITLIDRKVDIPAQNIYQYEPPRQFIQKLLKNNENTIAYCHNSPQLLLLATVSSKKGLFVCKSSQWQLFQHNLVINDLFPKVKPYSIQQILNSNSYNILITYDFSLIKTVLYQQKRQMVIIVEITAPISLETYILLKLKVYRFEEGNQCDTRKIETYQQSAWHIDNTATIMPGWYAFTTDFYQLPIIYESKNYENSLLSYRKSTCIKTSDFKPASQTINKNYVITNVPFEGLHLLKSIKDPTNDQQDYRPIVRYFQQNPVTSVYLHSGSYQLMVLLVYTLQKGAKIGVNSNYNNIHLLKKNLVINDLQIELLDDQSFNKTNVELIITQEQLSKDLLALNPKMFLFRGFKKIDSADFPNYQVYSFSQKEQCAKTTLQKLQQMPLETKTYILSKSS